MDIPLNLEKDVSIDIKKAAIGGVIATFIIFCGVYFVGNGSGANYRVLVGSMLPSVRFLCSSIMTATATTLALMLTLLSFSHNASRKLSAKHYEGIRAIAYLDVAVFLGSTLLLLVITLPVQESFEYQQGWFQTFYIAILSLSAVLGGALISIALLLLGAVESLILVAHPEQESHIVSENQSQSQVKEQKQYEHTT